MNKLLRKFGSRFNDHGKMWVPWPNQLRTTAIQSQNYDQKSIIKAY